MATNLEHKTLFNELTQGKELADQLKNHVITPCSSNQKPQLLLEKILSKYDKALSLLNKPAFMLAAVPLPPSPQPVAKRTIGPPIRENFDQEHSNYNKKRKTMALSTEQVRTGLGGSVENGYSWRKYGQSDILGTNFPRGYYRCTHGPSQGCLATKQVQRIDKDPTIFEVTYKGKHTCSCIKSLKNPSMTHSHSPSVLNSESNNQQKQDKSKESILKPVIDEEIFSSSTLNSCDVVPHNNFLGEFSPSFMMLFDKDSEFGSLGSDDHTCADNSPILGDMDLSLIKAEFDPIFPFDNPDIFLP